MPRVRMHHNPFLNGLVLVGLLFCLSAWLTFLVSSPTHVPAAAQAGEVQGGWLVTLFQQHAGGILLGELLGLAACAAAAMATDTHWSSRRAARCPTRDDASRPPAPD